MTDTTLASDLRMAAPARPHALAADDLPARHASAVSYASAAFACRGAMRNAAHSSNGAWQWSFLTR